MLKYPLVTMVTTTLLLLQDIGLLYIYYKFIKISPSSSLLSRCHTPPSSPSTSSWSRRVEIHFLVPMPVTFRNLATALIPSLVPNSIGRVAGRIVRFISCLASRYLGHSRSRCCGDCDRAPHWHCEVSKVGSLPRNDPKYPCPILNCVMVEAIRRFWILR